MRSIVLGTLTLVLLPGIAAKDGDRDPDIRYDMSTVIDVTGVVEDVREAAAPPQLRGIHILLKADGGAALDVYLGPVSFVKEFVSNFGRRSQIQAVGSKVKAGDDTVVLAREVRRGSLTLYLRDKYGTPYWTSSD